MISASNPGRDKRFFASPIRPDRPWVSASYSVNTRGFLPVGNAAEA